MPSPSTPLPINPQAQQVVINFINNTAKFLDNNWALRARLLNADRIYNRELDWSAKQRTARIKNMNGDVTAIQNPVVPVVGPQVESALTYLAEVYLASYPVFPIVAPPEMEDLALQLETLLGESAVQFQYVSELGMLLRDMLKYNLGSVELDWKKQRVGSISNDPTKVGDPKATEIIFQGNKIKRLDPYNCFYDTRVPPHQQHSRAEFNGYTEMLTRIELKQLFMDLEPTNTMNAKAAYESGTGAISIEGNASNGYYIPQVNPDAFMGQAMTTTNWDSWVGLANPSQINYSDLYEVTTLYWRVIPIEAHLPGPNRGTPQIWKFVIVNRKVVMFAQRQTNAHNEFPMLTGQLINDGLGWQTKSFLDNAAPYQQIATGLLNSAMSSQRRKVYDRIFYDPSRINKRDIDNTDPVARIAVKQEAYGTALSEAVYQAPYRDDGVPQILAFMREIVDMGDIASGQNRVQRGQFQKGNKTRYEVGEVMQGADSRPRMMSVFLESSFFQPLKWQLKMNILQYQPPAELFNTQAQKMVKVSPQDLRTKAWQFQVADGQLPVSKLVNLDLFGQAMQFASAQPQMAAEWDLLGMMAYMFKLQGARWVDQFKRTPVQQKQLAVNQGIANGNLPAGGTPLPQVGIQ